MDIAKVSGAVDSGYSTLAGALLLPREAGLASTLTLGQTLKGKVLMRQDQDRYRVLFADKEYMVHSDIKLVINEEIETKVVAIRQDFIHLKKAGRQTVEAEQPRDNLTSPNLIDRMANDYRILLAKADIELIQKMSRKADQAHLIATTKILFFVKKLGLIPTREMMEKLERLFLVKQPAQLANDLAGPAPDMAASGLGFDPTNTARQIQLMPEQLKQHIRNLFESENEAIFEEDADAPFTGREMVGPMHARPESGHQDSRGKLADNLMLRNLLNIQTETMLAHKYRPIAFLFDDQLIEIDLAIFSPRVKAESDRHMLRYAHHIGNSGDDRDSARGFAAANNHRLTFALETQSLGKIQIQVHRADKRLNIEFALSDETIVEQFRANSPVLESQFESYGWQLDEARYSVQEDDKGSMSFAKCAVVEHHILAGSLSRLI